MDTLALYSFDDGSLSVATVKFIRDYNPVCHNAKVWPRYKDATQKKNWVKVNWPNQDKSGNSTGGTSVHAAQVVRFGVSRPELEKLLNKMLDERNAVPKKDEKRQVHKKKDNMEDRLVKQLRDDLREQKLLHASPGGLEEPTDLPPQVQEPLAVPALARAEESGARVSYADAMAAVTEARAQAEARAVLAEAKAEQSEAREKEIATKLELAEARTEEIEARLEQAEARLEQAEARLEQAEARAEEAEARAEEAETKVLQGRAQMTFVLDDLLPALRDVPQILASLQHREAAGPMLPGVPGNVMENTVHFGDIVVTDVQMKRLDGKPASLYTQDLAVMVFGSDALAECCLSGSVTKPSLPKEPVQDLIDHVIAKFPGESSKTVKEYLRRKCSNTSYLRKKNIN
ncbi:uncharacterized protein LOC115332278 [Ixodes scapularis]|uniref:uncharacterized protein LOC115332278 n=1 Tax=Ixodes scapularis TaxID=6945 RepID=UPI001A9D812E|nr:uncharacterized protein LOC115332278 [Ixodes scapularis]